MKILLYLLKFRKLQLFFFSKHVFIYILRYIFNKIHNMITNDFIAKAKQIHGDRYDYSKVEYVNEKTSCICIKK